jgi:L-methionine (R)-S-oxide reductase
MHKVVHVMTATASDGAGDWVGTSSDIRAQKEISQATVAHGDPVDALPAAAYGTIAELATMAAKLLAADDCMIMLIENASRDPMTLRAYCVGLSSRDVTRQRWRRHGETAAREAIRAERSLVVDVPSSSRVPDEIAEATARFHTIVASPIRVGNSIVGALNLATRSGIRQRAPTGLAAVEIAAWLVGQSLHALRLETLLDSRFAQLAIASEAASKVGSQRLALAASRPDQLARILAKSFYREMVKLGCETSHVVAAASEIISQLNATLKRHCERLHRKTPKSLRGHPAAGNGSEQPRELHLR